MVSAVAATIVTGGRLPLRRLLVEHFIAKNENVSDTDDRYDDSDPDGISTDRR